MNEIKNKDILSINQQLVIIFKSFNKIVNHLPNIINSSLIGGLFYSPLAMRSKSSI